jgi:tetratricopeptide (TPR) repeat protein
VAVLSSLKTGVTLVNEDPLTVSRELLFQVLVVFGAVLVLASIALVVFGRGEHGELAFTIPVIEKDVKVKTFSMATLALGGALVVWPVYELTRDDLDTIRLGTVETIELLPPNPVWGKREPESDALRKIALWYGDFFDESRIVIDFGTNDGVRSGDYFATIYNAERAKGLHRKEIGNLQDELTSLIRVVSAYRTSSVCKLEEWAYAAHLRRLPDTIAVRGKPIDMARFAPVTLHQRVVAVPREEKVAKDAIDQEAGDASEASGELREKLYERAIDEVDEFLLDYPTGFYRGTVLFDKATFLFELGRYDDAVEAFEEFRDRFPYHPSAGAANEWIERAEDKRSES